MRVRNKLFTLILWTTIFLITGSLLLKINQEKYRTTTEQETNSNKPMVTIIFDDNNNDG